MVIDITLFQGGATSAIPSKQLKLSWGELQSWYQKQCDAAPGAAKGESGYVLFTALKPSTDEQLDRRDVGRARRGKLPLSAAERRQAKELGYRTQEHVDTVSALCLDYDRDPNEAPDWRESQWPGEGYAHSTHGWTPETPGKWRVILRLAEPMSYSDYQSLQQACKTQSLWPAGAILRNAVQPAFLPTCPQGRSVQTRLIRPGAPAFDWRPIVAQEQARAKRAPRSKLNQQYSSAPLPRALVQDLSKVWPGPEHGAGGHETALALGGVLADSTWDEDTIVDFTELLLDLAGTDHGLAEVLDSVAARRHGEGEERVYGWPTLIKNWNCTKVRKAELMNRMQELIPGLRAAAEQSAADKREQAAAEIKQAAEARGQAFLGHGTHEDIAKYLLSGPLAGTVKAVGRLWRPDENGIWQEVNKHRICKAVCDLARTPYVKENGKPGLLQVYDSTVKGVGGVFSDLLPPQDDFFASAPWGCAFQNNVFFGVNGPEKLSEVHRVRSTCHANFLPDCPPPSEALKAMGQWFEGCPDVMERQRFLLEHAGMSLLGASGIVAGFGVAAMLTGTGANGKSLWMQTVASMLPDGARASVSPQQMSNERHRTALEGALVNMVQELDAKGMQDSAELKQLVTHEPTSGRKLFGEAFVFTPRCTNMFGANELPYTADQSDGFWRRWVVIDFPHTFDGSDPQRQPDFKLGEKLTSPEERDKLATAAVVVALTAIREGKGYTIPSSAGAAKDEWKLETDPVRQWVDEIDLKPEPEMPTKDYAVASDLYEVFRQWAVSTGSGTRIMGRKRWAQRLEGMGFSYKKKQSGGRGFNCRSLKKGIRLVT